ncbi:rab domain-containing cell division control protein, partial [Hesseltinella vesiculosa]
MDIRVYLLSKGATLEDRGKVWKLLLRVKDVSATSYMSLVARGPSPMHEKIRNDAFRTLATDEQFLENVTEDMLIRVLNAFIWLKTSFPSGGITYVQGMNVLVAPFLMTMPEMDAFYAFSNFIWKFCPLYVQPNLKGLLDRCLKILDPQLYYSLLNKGLSANMYALPSMLTFCACTPPLDELFKLWDAMFAFGIHLNILFIIAQLALIRSDLLSSSSPMKLLRKFPNLEAASIVKITRSCIKNLPPELYDQLVRHASDET